MQVNENAAVRTLFWGLFRPGGFSQGLLPAPKGSLDFGFFFFASASSLLPTYYFLTTSYYCCYRLLNVFGEGFGGLLDGLVPGQVSVLCLAMSVND